MFGYVNGIGPEKNTKLEILHVWVFGKNGGSLCAISSNGQAFPPISPLERGSTVESLSPKSSFKALQHIFISDTAGHFI